MFFNLICKNLPRSLILYIFSLLKSSGGIIQNSVYSYSYINLEINDNKYD